MKDKFLKTKEVYTRTGEAAFITGAVLWSTGPAQVVAVPAAAMTAVIWGGSKACQKAYEWKAVINPKEDLKKLLNPLFKFKIKIKTIN